MIRKLSTVDYDACMQLLKRKPAENLFLIGDIENFGFDNEFQEVWGQWNENNLIAILLRYEKFAIIFAETNYDVEGFAAIVDQLDIEFVSGLDHLVEQLQSKMKRQVANKKVTYYAKCAKLAEIPVIEEELQYATSANYKKVFDLLVNIPEFSITEGQLESRNRTLDTDTGRTIYIEKDGKVVSTASTTAENSLSAMIISVATDSEYKGKGYGTKVVYELTKQLLKEGRECCLFYDNPLAGSIYKRIGFEDIGFWRMDRLVDK